MIDWMETAQSDASIHVRIEALEQFNCDTRLLVRDQAWWRANPLGMLWPEMNAALVTRVVGPSLYKNARSALNRSAGMGWPPYAANPLVLQITP